MQRNIDPSRVDWQTVNRTIEALDCRRLAEQYNVDVDSKNGDEWRVYCPAHPDRPGAACDISPDVVHCFSCGFEGGALALFNEVAGMHCNLDDPEQRDAVKVALAESQGVNPYRNNDGRANGGDPRPQPPTPEPRKPPSGRGDGRKAARRDDDLAEPGDVRLELLGQLWDAVEPLGLTDPARAWLEARGIRPMVAQAYGWRDWRPARDTILEVLEGYSPAEKLQAGLLGRSSRDGEVYGWKPLRGLAGEWTNTRGLMIPVWHPNHEAAPVALRFRPYRPEKYKRGGRKSDDQPSAHLDFSPPPLGLRTAPPEMQVMMAQHEAGWPHAMLDMSTARRWLGTHTPDAEPNATPRRLDDYPGRWMAVVCEGETDMLAVADAALEVPEPIRIAPVALAPKTSPLPREMMDLLAGAERIVMALDTGDDPTPPSEIEDVEEAPPWYQRTHEVIRGMVRHHGSGGKHRVTFKGYPESYDLNDQHEDGKLADKLRTWTEGLT